MLHESDRESGAESSERVLLREAPEPVFLYRPDGILLDLSDLACEALGYERAEVIGTDVSRFILDADPARTVEARALDMGDRARRMYGRHRRRDGTTYPVEVHVSSIEWRGTPALLAHARQITPYSDHDTPTTAVHILEALLQTAPVGIITSDRQHRITRWNPAAERILGWTSEEVVGRSNPAIPPEDENRYMAVMEGILEGASHSGIEVTRRRKDGSNVRLRIATAPLRNESNRIIGSMGILDDITDREQTEARLREVEKMESIGRLAGGIAHDFNNYLTSILSLTELVLLEPDLDEQIRDDVGQIKQAASCSAALTRQLLTFAHPSRTDEFVVDINKRIGDISRLLSRSLSQGVDIKLDLCEQPLLIRCDASRVDQVLLNLVTNADDAISGDGWIWIRTSRNKDQALITVEDSGPGIPEEDVDRIFEPFFSTKDLGAGLGLATVYGVMRGSGGKIRVSSKPGGGATFHLSWPLAEEDDPAAG